MADAPAALAVIYRPLADLIPYARNARTHSDAQVAQIATSIVEFGFTNPVLVDSPGADGRCGILAGHGRVLAARKLGLATAQRSSWPTSRRSSAAPTCSPTTDSPSRPGGIATCW